MPPTVEQFTKRLADSGILLDEQLRDFIAALPEGSSARSNAEEMARELVRQKKLTRYQAEQIYAGQGESLTLGNYVILDKLGQGGMGIVLKAEHKRMKRLVAIKVMSPAAVKTPDALRRFHREVEAAAKLRHTNIVAADDADEAHGTHFLVMEYVEGSDLSAHVKKNGPFPVEQAVNCVIQAARGLEYAHKRGVVHRDIKPANLLLDREGTVKILDMGLARIEGEIGEQAELTSTGAVMGTVDYMAPEQARNTKAADARSDIYSLGITLWYLLTGRPAFDGQTLTERLLAHQADPIPSLADAVTRVSRASQSQQEAPSTIATQARHFAPPSEGTVAALDAVFRRMVAKRPGDRPQSMTEVIAELERCLVGETPALGSATVSFVSSDEIARQVKHDQVTGLPTEIAVDSGLAATMISSTGDSPLNVTVPHVPNNVGSFDALKASSILADEMRGGNTPDVQAGAVASKVTPSARGRSNSSPGESAISRRWIMIGAAFACVALGAGLFSFFNGSPRRTDSASNGSANSKPLEGQNQQESESHRTAIAGLGDPSGRKQNDPEREAAEWIINNGGKVDVAFGQSQIGKLADLPNEKLQIIGVNYEKKLNFSKADAEVLAKLSHLNSIGFSESTLAPGAIKPLADCDSLRSILISGGSTSPETFEELLRLEKIEGLQLDQNQFDDQFVVKLGQLQRLRVLQLFGNVKLTDTGIVRLCESAPPHLEDLSLGGVKIGSKCMEAISRLPHLQNLSFTDAQLSDDVIGELHRCQSLARISLARESISKGKITELQAALDGCQFRVSHPDQASPLNNVSYREAIQRLVARGYHVGLTTEKVGGISLISGKAPIPAGDVVFAEGISVGDPNDPAVLQLDQSGVDDLVQLKDLQYLTLRMLPTGGLQSLLPLKNLTFIAIEYSVLTDSECRQLASFGKLRHLLIQFQNDDALRAVAALPHLSRLRIGHQSQLSKDCLELLENSKALRQLDVSENMPLDATRAFADARPDVTVYWNGELIRPAAKTVVDTPDVPRRARAPFNAHVAREHQLAWAKHLGTEVESTNSVGQKMVLIPPGEFLMGSSDEQVATALKAAADMKADRGVIGRIESSERPQHRVVMSQPLRMSATEVTVGQFKRFVAASKYVTEAERYGFGDSGGTALNDKVTETQRQSNWRSPGYTVDDNSPVAQITWNDAVAYCKWLSDQEKITYRLPTEAEWEYACRAGTTTQYSFGDDYKALPKYGWPIENAVIQSHPVGTQLPNSFGLFDMHGNLYEWCSDYFEANWYAASPVSDPIGPVSGGNRVLRGGSIHNGPSQCRSASRYSNSPSGRFKDYGFRCVAELDLSTENAGRFALHFDGTGSHVDVPTLRLNGLKEFTIEARVRPAVRPGTKGSILAGLSDPLFALDVNEEGRLSGYLMRARQPDGAFSPTFVDGSWHDIAATVNGSKIELFIDGKPQPVETPPYGIVPDAVAVPRDRFLIGAGQAWDVRAIIYPFHGDIDQLRVSRVIRHRGEYVPSERLTADNETLALYNFDEGSGPELKDSSGNNHHGKIIGAKWIKVAALKNAMPGPDSQRQFASDEWIDVMPMLNPNLDKVDIGRALVGKNDWRIEDGELRYYGDDKSGKLYFPVRCLGRSQDCEFEFTRTAGNISFNVDIPVPDGFVPLTIGNDKIGFVNESLTEKFQIVNGQRAKLRLRVTQVGADDRLEVFVNDQPLVDWKGTLAKHKIEPPRTDARNPSEHFSLFAHGPTNYSFRAIRMRMLNGGSAKSLRPAVAANAKPWIDWLGPKVQRGDFDGNPNGWVREGEAVTTEHVISGIEVLPPTTRDGAIRVTYLLRDAKGIAINARDHLMANDSDFRELYVVEDLRDSLRLAYARAGQQDRSLATQAIGADIPKDLPRTLEFRVIGDTLTVTLNGSMVVKVKDSTIPVGNFALVALKGVLIQKVEYQSLDSLK